LIVGPKHERPNASWRQRLAAARKLRRAKRQLSVLVTTSAIARGVLRVMNWLTPLPPGHETITVSTFEEAVSWAEERRGRPLPILRQIYEKVS
jgi:hypothetical protein